MSDETLKELPEAVAPEIVIVVFPLSLTVAIAAAPLIAPPLPERTSALRSTARVALIVVVPMSFVPLETLTPTLLESVTVPVTPAKSAPETVRPKTYASSLDLSTEETVKVEVSDAEFKVALSRITFEPPVTAILAEFATRLPAARLPWMLRMRLSAAPISVPTEPVPVAVKVDPAIVVVTLRFSFKTTTEGTTVTIEAAPEPTVIFFCALESVSSSAETASVFAVTEEALTATCVPPVCVAATDLAAA